MNDSKRVLKSTEPCRTPLLLRLGLQQCLSTTEKMDRPEKKTGNENTVQWMESEKGYLKKKVEACASLCQRTLTCSRQQQRFHRNY